MKRRRSRRSAAAARPAGGLMLAPMVALMRLPLMAAEARSTGKWAAESALAINEKMAAMAEGVFAAQMSLLGSASQFWPEVLAGKTPSVLSGVAANFRRLSKL